MWFTSSSSSVDTLDLNTALDAKENALCTQDLPLHIVFCSLAEKIICLRPGFSHPKGHVSLTNTKQLWKVRQIEISDLGGLGLAPV